MPVTKLKDRKKKKLLNALEMLICAARGVNARHGYDENNRPLDWKEWWNLRMAIKDAEEQLAANKSLFQFSGMKRRTRCALCSEELKLEPDQINTGFCNSDCASAFYAVEKVND